MRAPSFVTSLLVGVSGAFGLWVSGNRLRFAVLCAMSTALWLLISYAVHRWGSALSYLRVVINGAMLCLCVPLLIFGDMADDIGALTFGMALSHFEMQKVDLLALRTGALLSIPAGVAFPLASWAHYLAIASTVLVLVVSAATTGLSSGADACERESQPPGKPSALLRLLVALLCLAAFGSVCDAATPFGLVCAWASALLGAAVHKMDLLGRRGVSLSTVAVALVLVLQVLGAERAVGYAAPSLWALVQLPPPAAAVATESLAPRKIPVQLHVLQWAAATLVLGAACISAAQEYRGALYLVPLLLTHIE